MVRKHKSIRYVFDEADRNKLDKHYEEHRSFSAGNDMRGDLHAFYFTEDDTAIYTGYDKVGKDLSSLGAPEDGYIWDSLFQELDVATGEVIFQWRASDHFSFADVSVKPNKATKKDPWDWFHINMVEKDRDGNFLVSTRYGRCALYISGKTGEVLWQLGGNKNSFIDLSNGDATTFLGQHDIHWAEGHKYITVFDNRADWYHRIENHSRGHKIEIDLEKMTAKLIQSYTHPVGILSTSQGSMQMLPNGNVLMGYGFTGVLTEFSPDGEALCDAYMQPSKRFGSGEVQSYRDLKFNWTGIPLTTPDIAYHRGSVYMSWLGSTKVRSWLLQDSDTADGLYESVQSTPKQGFETQFTLNLGKRMRQYVRAIAVDEGGTQLSISPPVDLVNSTEIWGKKPANMLEDDDHDDMEVDYAQDVEDVQVLLVLGSLALISGLLIAWMTIGLRRKRGWGAKSFASINRAAWQRVRSGLAGTSKYRDDSSAGSELLSRRRDSDTSLGDDEMVNFSREDFRLYDRTGYQ